MLWDVHEHGCGNVRCCGNTVLWECTMLWEHSAVGMYDVVGTQCCGTMVMAVGMYDDAVGTRAVEAWR